MQMMQEEPHSFYVEFEHRPAEDRAASIREGHPVFKDVEFAIITMPGGSLTIDKEITPELIQEWQRGSARKPPSPFAMRAYDAWKDDLDVPVNGMDLKNWPGVTPAQLKMCHGATIRTVEDLANINADAMRRLGMGGVALRDKAKSYLESAEQNKSSEAIVALQVRMDEIEASNQRKDDRIAELEADLAAATAPKKRGRPRKVQDDAVI